MKEKKRNEISVLLDYAGSYKVLTYVGLVLSAIAMVLGTLPYICIWLVVRDLIAVAPQWTKATEVTRYGVLAFVFAFGGIIVYFAALMCTHLSAFRTASNIRKKGMKHLMKTPLGFFDTHASGYLRNRLDGAASDTETLLAHNMADMSGTIAMFITMLVLMFMFDWRMGAACFMAALVSIIAMSSMMGGKNASLMMEYQSAQDVMSKAGTEYVRGIPVVKVFQQTVYSFKAFKQAIEDYSAKAEKYTVGVCQMPQAVNLTVTEGAFIFLAPVAIFIAPSEIRNGSFATFITNFAFYAVFSAIISTALAKIMFAAGGTMMAQTAVARFNEVMNAPVLEITDNPKEPQGNTVEFKDVSFTYEGSGSPALSHVSFKVKGGQTVALVGPSGGGKTTAASLIPRFWDATEGAVEIGGVNVKDTDPHVLMSRVAFVFQNNRLFKTSILENVRIARRQATREEVLAALEAAQCKDILEKLEKGVDTVIGTEGTYLSGGEQQRVALARAILKDAPIVVLDEATAFADPENEVLIQKALSTLMKDKTVIMIAHRLSTVVGADRIIVLDNGEVVEQGKHEELVNNNGLYSKMWEDYNKAVKWKISASEEVR
ncbi:MAG: ABC transporter ATP-binding protein/permease [Sphaerochaetaceae bacterium]|nr:ABC transporter ATP-binding protein/permease [Sphaerochaetaceae bacterium]